MIARLAVTLCAISLIASSQSTSQYPASWWAPVSENGKPDWEILPQSAKPGEVILSKRNELGILSNFAATPFTLRAKRYASVEGFWQMMLYPESAADPRAVAPRVTWRYTRAQVTQMTSFEAKEAGTLAEANMLQLGIDWVTYEGARMLYRSPVRGEHYRLIREAMRAKLDQNPKVREVLLSTGDLILRPDHIQEKDAPPEWAYFQIWMEIRNELRSATGAGSAAFIDFSDQPKYVVAGVADSAYMGGHGSEAGVRSAESLARAMASLKNDMPPGNAGVDGKTETSLHAAILRDPSNAALHHSMAAVEERSGKPVDAVHEYQEAADLDPSENNLFDWGTELLIHDAPPAAAEAFERGIRRYPRSKRILLGSAVAFYLRGDYAQAARRFFAATDLNPSDPKPYLFLGDVQTPEITETPDCRERLRRFAQLQPNNAQANYLYATTMWDPKTGPHDGRTLASAQAALERAVHLDPAFGPAYLRLGMLYAEQSDISAAIEAYRKAINADPNLEQAHYRLAAAYRKQGDNQNAQRETEMFEQLSKNSAQLRDRERSSLQRFVVNLKSADLAH